MRPRLPPPLLPVPDLRALQPPGRRRVGRGRALHARSSRATPTRRRSPTSATCRSSAASSPAPTSRTTRSRGPFDFDHAYWMSELTPVDAATAWPRFDGTLAGHAGGADGCTVPEAGGPASLGQAGPYAMTGLAWLANPLAAAPAKVNGFELDAHRRLGRAARPGPHGHRPVAAHLGHGHHRHAARAPPRHACGLVPRRHHDGHDLMTHLTRRRFLQVTAGVGAVAMVPALRSAADAGPAPTRRRVAGRRLPRAHDLQPRRVGRAGRRQHDRGGVLHTRVDGGRADRAGRDAGPRLRRPHRPQPPRRRCATRATARASSCSSPATSTRCRAATRACSCRRVDDLPDLIRDTDGSDRLRRRGRRAPLPRHSCTSGAASPSSTTRRPTASGGYRAPPRRSASTRSRRGTGAGSSGPRRCRSATRTTTRPCRGGSRTSCPTAPWASPAAATTTGARSPRSRAWASPRRGCTRPTARPASIIDGVRAGRTFVSAEPPLHPGPRVFLTAVDPSREPQIVGGEVAPLVARHRAASPSRAAPASACASSRTGQVVERAARASARPRSTRPTWCCPKAAGCGPSCSSTPATSSPPSPAPSSPAPTPRPSPSGSPPTGPPVTYATPPMTLPEVHCLLTRADASSDSARCLVLAAGRRPWPTPRSGPRPTSRRRRGARHRARRVAGLVVRGVGRTGRGDGQGAVGRRAPSASRATTPAATTSTRRPRWRRATRSGEGTPVDKLLGYRWTGKRFEQIPFQVDELATRYLSNNASTFSVYSQIDQHTTYVFDEERFRWTQVATRPTRAAPSPDGPPTTPDPVPGLDTNDEVSFMASDAGARGAGRRAAARRASSSAKQVRRHRPEQRRRPAGRLRDGRGRRRRRRRRRSSTRTNGYVRYQPDADSDTFLFSESSYETYGNTFKGPWFDPATGTLHHRPAQAAPAQGHGVDPHAALRLPLRRPLAHDRSCRSRPSGPSAARRRTWKYGPDLIDQWKARAFQQRPGGETPCCGYEEEVNNWGGSSMLMGVAGRTRARHPRHVGRGLVDQQRAHRDLLPRRDPPDEQPAGARDPARRRHLRAVGLQRRQGHHVLQPVGARRRRRRRPQRRGVRQHLHARRPPTACACRTTTPSRSSAPRTSSRRHAAARVPESEIDEACIHNDIDVADPTFGGPNPGLNYEQVTGPFGTLVHRLAVKQVTAGAAYSLATVPVLPRRRLLRRRHRHRPRARTSSRAPSTRPSTAPVSPRECWTPEPGRPVDHRSPRDHFYQGDIGTHGVHIEFIADSDNALTTLPLTEIDVGGAHRRAPRPAAQRGRALRTGHGEAARGRRAAAAVMRRRVAARRRGRAAGRARRAGPAPAGAQPRA